MSKIKEALAYNNLPVTNGDGWDAVPERGNDLIRGKILKFKDGLYFLGGLAEPLNGTAVAVLDVAVAWVKWVDGKPEHRITRPGQRHPNRDELGDNDQDLWPEDRNGKPEDPWKDTRYVYLIDPQTAEEMTFIT